MKKNSTLDAIILVLKILLFPIAIFIALVSAFSTPTNSKNKKKSNYTDKELDAYGLTKDEKKLVKKGEYDPWQFEESEEGDELDSDDYYYDDF